MSSADASRRNRVRAGGIAAMVVLVRGDTEVASWPLMVPGRVDVAVVDDLARLHLAARRLGCSICLRGAGTELSELLDLAGLADIMTGVGS